MFPIFDPGQYIVQVAMHATINQIIFQLDTSSRAHTLNDAEDVETFHAICK